MLIFGNLVNCIYMLNHVKLMLPDAPGNNSSPCKDTRRVRAFLRKEGRRGWRRFPDRYSNRRYNATILQNNKEKGTRRIRFP